MNQTITKLCLIFSITLFISVVIVQCDEDESGDHFKFDIKVNRTENPEIFNATDDYDYNDDNSEEENHNDINKPSFIDKVILLHNERKNATFVRNVNHINETYNRIRIAMKNMNHLFKSDKIENLKLLEFISEIDTGLSNGCSAAFTRILSGIGNRDIWALKFLDSMGRFPPPGFAEGIQSSFGEYDECLDITSFDKEDNAQVIKGQYCLMKAILPFPSLESYKEGEPIVDQMDMSSSLPNLYNLQKLSSVKGMIEGLNLSNGTIYRLGICIPSVCSPDEVEYMINKLLYPIFLMPLEIDSKCHVKDEPIKFDNFQLTSISIFCVLIILVILSTGFHIYQKQSELEIDEKTTEKCTKNFDILLSFSIIRNVRCLFAKNTKFAALDTIRLLVIINVHFGHLYQYTTNIGVISLKKIFSQVMFKVYEDNKYVFVRSPLPMDALFVMSGFLLSFGLLKKLEKTKGRFNYIEFLFQRWFKFLILMFGSLIFFYLYPLFGDGPIWDTGVQHVTPGCKDPTVLMKMFFFINNYRPSLRDVKSFALQQCNPSTWFLSTLLQLTLVAPIFIVLYFKKPTLGLIVTISAIIASLIASISPTIIFGMKPYLQIWELDSVVFSITDSFTWYHMTPNVYAISFFVGIASGYLMRKDISFTRLQEKIFWILSAVMIITVYFWNNTFWRLDKSAPLLSVLLWHTIGKLFFSIGFAWIYYACCTGRGGFLNRFLSWHGFQPLARLSFGIYLLHYLVLKHRIFSVKNIFVMTDKLMIEHIIFDLIIDTLLAFIFYILIESPFTKIFEVLVTRKPLNNLDNLNNNKQISNA